MVVDSSVLVAIFRHEEEASIFVDLIDGSETALVSMVTVVETTSVLCGRRIGARREQVDRLIANLALSAQPVDERQQETAIHALLAFGKGRHPAKLNLGNCFAYALRAVPRAAAALQG